MNSERHRPLRGLPSARAGPVGRRAVPHAPRPAAPRRHGEVERRLRRDHARDEARRRLRRARLPQRRHVLRVLLHARLRPGAPPLPEGRRRRGRGTAEFDAALKLQNEEHCAAQHAGHGGLLFAEPARRRPPTAISRSISRPGHPAPGRLGALARVRSAETSSATPSLRTLRLLYLDCGTEDEFYLHLGARQMSAS